MWMALIRWEKLRLFREKRNPEREMPLAEKDRDFG